MTNLIKEKREQHEFKLVEIVYVKMKIRPSGDSHVRHNPLSNHFNYFISHHIEERKVYVKKNPFAYERWPVRGSVFQFKNIDGMETIVSSNGRNELLYVNYQPEDAEDDERESVPVYFHKYTLVSIKEVE